MAIAAASGSGEIGRTLPGKDATQGQVQVLRAENIGRLGPPARALFSEGARRMLALASVERRLLRELLCLNRRRRSTMVSLELQPKRRQSGLDIGSARGPDAQKLVVEADDLAHGPLIGAAAFAVGESDAKSVGQQRLKAGVVPLGCGDLVLEQRPPVQRQPAAVTGADLVRHRDVGVQVGISGARIAVRECRRDEPGAIDLGDALSAAAGVGGVLLEPADRVGNGVLVSFAR